MVNYDHIDFNGAIKIEIRGSSSSLLTKKQYALTTYDSMGQKDNVKILGMPKDNDWILNGIAYDSSLIRDYLSYQLSNQIGQYASRGKYCEVMLNGIYYGIYLFQEKLKIDNDRIDIKKIKPEETIHSSQIIKVRANWIIREKYDLLFFYVCFNIFSVKLSNVI